MRLREYSVANTYTSCFLTEIGDLDAAAARLVGSDLALSAYVVDGNAYWRQGAGVASGPAKLAMRDHETHAKLVFPDGLAGIAKLGVQTALMHRFSERKVLTPIDGPHHQYLRAQMSPYIIGIGDDDLLVGADLKLYKNGVFALTLTVDTPEEGIDVATLIERYVNLFGRWADRTYVPTGVAILGASSALLTNHRKKSDREAAVDIALLYRKVAKRFSETLEVAGAPLSFFPAHLSVDDLLSEPSEDQIRSHPPQADAPVSSVEPSITSAESTELEDANAVHASPADEAERQSQADLGSDGHLTASFVLSDIFENLAFAMQVALEPPRDGKEYVRHGPNSALLQRGTHWHARPFVVIRKFDNQPLTASEIRNRFGEELGSIMGRVPRASARVVAAQMTDSLRLFEDRTFHVNSALSLCVYAAPSPGSPREEPEFSSVFDVACSVEMMDYYAARVGQLIEMVSSAKTMKRVRDIRAELGAAEAGARTVFQSGELRDAMSIGWKMLGVPELLKEAREKMSLQVDVLAEEAADRSGAQNLTLTVVFGILGAAGISDSVVKPLWEACLRSPSDQWSGPFYFAVTAALLVFLLWGVSWLARRE